MPLKPVAVSAAPTQWRVRSCSSGAASGESEAAQAALLGSDWLSLVTLGQQNAYTIAKLYLVLNFGV
jgi:hypothetical protein